MSLTRRNLLQIAAGAAAQRAGKAHEDSDSSLPAATVTDPDTVEVAPAAQPGAVVPESFRMETIPLLMSATRCLIEDGARGQVTYDPARYETMFVWRAENLPGHRLLYEKFAIALNSHSNITHGVPFDRCDIATRRKIVAQVTEAHQPQGVPAGLTNAQDIVALVFDMFSLTDAQGAIGYKVYRPMGLDDYELPPADYAGAAPGE